jgi:hypothetical protein
MRESMALEELSVFSICGSIAVPQEDRFATPTLLPICCMCGLVRDETGSSLDGGHGERWVTAQIYRQTSGVNPTECALTHTYCPECLVKAQNTVRTFLLEMGALP